MVKKVVVAGAVGVIGRTVIAHFEKLDGWEVVGLSRSKPDFPTKAKHVSVDLLDEAASRKTLSEFAMAAISSFWRLRGMSVSRSPSDRSCIERCNWRIRRRMLRPT